MLPDPMIRTAVLRRPGFLLGAGAALLAGCARVPPADVGFVAQWTRTHYALARAERLSPPVASRVSAYAAVALYEGWARGSDSLRTLAGQLNGLDSLPGPLPRVRYDRALVALEAQTVVLRELYRGGFASTDVAIGALRDSLLAVRAAAGVTGALRDSSLAYGARLGRAIVAWAAADGFAGRSLAYEAATGPAAWVPTANESQFRAQNLSAQTDVVLLDDPTGRAAELAGERSLAVNRPLGPGATYGPGINPTQAMEPHWGDLRPFALPSADSCWPRPPVPYSEAPGSAFHREAMAVYEAVKEATPDQRETAYYWADNPGESGTPAGHWLGVVSKVAMERNLDPERAVEAYALMAIAMADAFIASWKVKYAYNLVRPVTYIQRLIDPAFQTVVTTPPFPEYTSGHSVQSAAAAEALAAVLGDTPFTDDIHVAIGHAPRSFRSFREAAREAQMSRLYGGIHYPMGIDVGAEQGTCIGRVVVERVRTR
jgi:hypothetical protein